MLHHEFCSRRTTSFFCRLFKIKSRTIWRGYAFTITAASRIAYVNAVRCARAFRTEPRGLSFFFFFSFASARRITLRRGLSTSCIARSCLSRPPSFFPHVSENARGYSYLTRGGDKKWRLSRIGPFENLPIVRRRAASASRIFRSKARAYISRGIVFSPPAKRSTKIRSLRRPFDLGANISKRFLMDTHGPTCSWQMRLSPVDFSRVMRFAGPFPKGELHLACLARALQKI